MKNTQNHYEALLRLGSIPEKMIKTHGCENLAEFVLHELCHEACIPFNKIAFFIDNPDFNCFKGVVGISHHERFLHNDVWNNVTDFSNHMHNARFNQSTRSISRESMSKAGTPWDQCAEQIGKVLTVENPGWYMFSAKHGNTGLLLFAPQTLNDHMHMTLAAASSLLGLCPVF